MIDSEGGQALDVGRLLTIDVESELRKLTQAQLQGPWQLPAELVRRALRYGARRVEVEIGRAQIRIRSRGGSVPDHTLRELAALLDPGRSPKRRHRALAALEQSGELSLLGLVGLDPSSIRILSPEANAAGEAMGLTWRRRGKAEVQRFSGPGPAQAEVTVRGAKLDRSRARAWLEVVAAHSAASIVVDGRELRGGFEDAISVFDLHHPMAGTIALPREGEVARLYLLQDGIVSTHLSLSDTPCFEAALETRSLAEPGASAARLRDLIAPHIQEIVTGVLDHMIQLGEEGTALTASDRSRLAQQLLVGARRDRERAKIIARLPLFLGIERDGRQRWCDLLALRQSIREESDERFLTALSPDQDTAEFSPEQRIFVLDDAQRAQLGELLELGFRQPRRKVEARRGMFRTIREGLRSLRARDLLVALRPGGRPIPDADLDPPERHLLDQLRGQLDGCEFSFCTGSGPVRRVGRGPDKLLLPRHSAQVELAVAAVERDPGWVYPALLALLEGRVFPLLARRRWRVDTWSLTTTRD